MNTIANYRLTLNVLATLLAFALTIVSCKSGDKTKKAAKPPEQDLIDKPLVDNSLQVEPGKVIDGAKYFVCAVSEIKAPKKITTKDVLQVQVLGNIGSNGCYGFHGFDRSLASSSSLKISTMGYFYAPPEAMCTMAIVDLDQTYEIQPPHTPGLLSLEFVRPNGQKSLYANIEIVAP